MPEYRLDVDPGTRRILVELHTSHSVVGWQIFDPDTATFIAEGDWTRAGDAARIEIQLPPERGRYQVYVSGIDEAKGWAYQNGEPFLLVEAAVAHAQAHVSGSEFLTLARLRRRNWMSALRKALVLPVRAVTANSSLIRSMVRRDVLARYRGSFGDVLWTVINPLLLMLTYFFVFGVVLETRFGPDASRTGFTLYFLAGMLPWLAFSEAIGRAPQIVLEHRNFVKKLMFPVEILPVNQTVAGLVTSGFALALFLLAVLVLRGSIPITSLALPLILIPQVLFTLGIAWFLSALGVYVRDLAQVMGFLLTLLFFLTPICYPESQLPPQAVAVLSKSPIYALVRGYRMIFLEGVLPSAAWLIKLWITGAAAFFLGYAWFHKLRKSFADVI